MFCRFCGKEIAKDSKFCCYCGNQVVSEYTETAYERKDLNDTPHPVEVKKNVDVRILKNDGIKKSSVANEVIANLKMISLFFFVVIIFFLGFNIYHSDDIKPMDENVPWGYSCYDKIIPGLVETPWEHIYYDDIYDCLPYSEWGEVSRKVGIPDRDMSIHGSQLNLFGYVQPKDALKRAEKNADEKNIPNYIREKLKKSAQEEAEKIKERVREDGTYYRKKGFEEDRDNKMKWCAIISFCFFVLGRYIIKIGKWIAANKSQD